MDRDHAIDPHWSETFDPIFQPSGRCREVAVSGGIDLERGIAIADRYIVQELWLNSQGVERWVKARSS
jgi:hypothetical protein